MRKAAILPLVLASTLLTAGCVTPTPYQPYRDEWSGGVHGGYSDKQLAADIFRVRFHGNELAARDRVEGYMLYRAAELTLQRGFDWFVILDRHTEHDRQTYIEPNPAYEPYYGSAYGGWQPHWRYWRGGTSVDWHPERTGRFWSDEVDMRTVDSYEAEAEIMVRKRPMPADTARSFDARKVIADLEPLVERPAP